MATKSSPHVESEKTDIIAAVEPAISLTNLLLLVVIVLNAAGLYLLAGNTISLDDGSVAPLGLKKAILEVEYEKVGGKENFDIQSRAQQLSLKDPQNPGNIDGMKKYIASFNGQTPDTSTPALTSTVSLENVVIDTGSIQATLSGDTVIEGNPEALITVTEYSDMECPFCMKQFHNTKLKEKLFEQYGNKVNFVFKNSRWVNHAGTTPKAIAALCVQQIAGPVAYVQYYTAIMQGTTSNSNVFPVALLGELAKKLNVDETKWKACYTTKETMSLFEKQTSEAEGYGLNGTPWTRVVNNKTNKSEKIEGAYPYETFTEKIDSLLK
jgi:protein-disulfide isomerase